MTDQPENAGQKEGRDQKGRWRKGVSGNAAGKMPGTRHKATTMAETLLCGQVEKLTRKAVDMAMDGDTTALRLCLERILPARRGREVTISLPQLEGTDDIVGISEAILAATVSGELTPDEAEALAKILDTHRKMIETIDLHQRVAALEADAEDRHQGRGRRT